MKPFSQELHDQNDKIAKDAVLAFMRNTWNLDCGEGDKYGVDLEVYRHGLIEGYVEAERRHNWVDNWPYKTAHVPARKEKLFTFYPTILFAVRQDCKQALYAKAKDILSSPVIKLDNKYMAAEPFFDVPIQKWTLVTL